MSNLTKGKRVRLKSTGECGVIRDIERTKRADGQHEDVTFLVKMDRPGWVSCERHALELLVPVKTEQKKVYPKVYSVKKTIGGRTITVVGKVEIFIEKYISSIDGNYAKLENGKTKSLAIGWAICHPDDEEGDFGFALALKRCDERPMAEYYCPYMGEFREDIVMAMLNVKMDYIENNIDKFINKSKL